MASVEGTGSTEAAARKLKAAPRAHFLRRTGVLGALLLAAAAAALEVGTTHEIRLAGFTPLSSNSELVRRLMTPRRAVKVQRDLAARGAALTGQPVDPAAEHFIVYVPQQAPPHGYGLVVFVPPWPEASMPYGWEPVFERAGVIYASFAHAGNDQGVQFRRIPLAVLAAADLAKQYPVDPSRIYVAGFSGGARVALRAALAYPDLFAGALLISGSDAIGSAEIPLPPRELFLKFQDSTRLVYLSGQHDDWALRQAAASLASMHDWCVYGVGSQTMAMKAHELPEAALLARALESLQAPAHPSAGKLAVCRAGMEGELAKGFDQVAALAAAGRSAESLRRLDELDERYGGLAAPRSLEMATP